MMDAEPLFIDTNILIYANVATAPPAMRLLAQSRGKRQSGLSDIALTEAKLQNVIIRVAIRYDTRLQEQGAKTIL